MTEDAGTPDLRAGAASTQSKNTLRLAEALGLLTYRMPVEIRAIASLRRVLAELGEDIEQITDDAGYYWVYVPIEDEAVREAKDRNEEAILIPEGEVRPFVLALAAAKGVASKFKYRTGIVPR